MILILRGFTMSPVRALVCAANYPRAPRDAALIQAEFLLPDAFDSGTFLEEGNAAMRRRAESISQYKLPTYQAAAVVVRTGPYGSYSLILALTFFFFFSCLSTQSTVLAGVESQLLVFFKSSPDFTQQPVPVTLQYLLVITYIALIFSVSTTISSLVLTRNFGNVPMLVGRLQEKIRGMSMLTFEISPLRTRYIVPLRWWWLEVHCTFGGLRAQ